MIFAKIDQLTLKNHRLKDKKASRKPMLLDDKYSKKRIK